MNTFPEFDESGNRRRNPPMTASYMTDAHRWRTGSLIREVEARLAKQGLLPNGEPMSSGTPKRRRKK